MDPQESTASDIPLPDDVHSPDYIAAYSTRILAHIEQFPELTAPAEFLTLEATPHGLLMQAAPDLDHGRLLLRLRQRLERGLGDRAAGLSDSGYVEVLENIGLSLGASERVPDLTVVNWNEHVDVRSGKAITAQGVLLLVEVTSSDRRDDLDQLDATAKPRQYAAAGVPVYLAVDRRKGAVLVFSDPESGTYPEPAVYEIGEKIWLPKPMSFHLETDFMKAFL
ncbi:Uma2 family endonuclease [Yinghuangia sp. YIM S10712]|uniref:Uma2 family endonuclease n=1 Tax=Yinghuangia sp. YIM S10712 TaxID=3436930 RepID=UPI003F536A9B